MLHFLGYAIRIFRQYAHKPTPQLRLSSECPNERSLSPLRTTYSYYSSSNSAPSDSSILSA